jgi:hypothetical protein
MPRAMCTRANGGPTAGTAGAAWVWLWLALAVAVAVAVAVVVAVAVAVAGGVTDSRDINTDT